MAKMAGLNPTTGRLRASQDCCCGECGEEQSLGPAEVQRSRGVRQKRSLFSGIILQRGEGQKLAAGEERNIAKRSLFSGILKVRVGV